MANLSYLITVYDRDTKSFDWVTISAFCPQCGEKRGRPRLRPRRIDSIDTWIHQWNNGCGHQDSLDSVLAEISMQCAHRNCPLMQSDTFHPYCGPTCSIRSAWDAVADMRNHSQTLIEPLEVLRRLSEILSTCPFQGEVEELQYTLQEASRAIAKTQARLSEAASDVIREATQFGLKLDNLIAAADEDVRQNFSAWMNYSEDWIAQQGGA